MPRFFEGIFGDEIVKNFRRPLEVRLGTLLVALIVFGAAVTVAVFYIQKNFPGEPGRLAQAPAVESLQPEAAAPGEFPGDGEPGTPPLPGSGQGIQIPDLIPPAAAALPEIRNIVAAPAPKQLPQPPKEVKPEPSPPGPPPPEPGHQPAAAGAWYIQVQALLFEEHFTALAEYMTDLGFTNINKFPMKAKVLEQTVYMLWIGPYASRDDTVVELDRFKELNRQRPFTKFPKFKLQLAFPIELPADKE